MECVVKENFAKANPGTRGLMTPTANCSSGFSREPSSGKMMIEIPVTFQNLGYRIHPA
jgi:hypothetical protein